MFTRRRILIVAIIALILITVILWLVSQAQLNAVDYYSLF